MHEEILFICTSCMKNVTIFFYFTEVADKQYLPPFPKLAITLLCSCTGVMLNIGFENVRPDFEILKMKAEIFLKKKKKWWDGKVSSLYFFSLFLWTLV